MKSFIDYDHLYDCDTVCMMFWWKNQYTCNFHNVNISFYDLDAFYFNFFSICDAFDTMKIRFVLVLFPAAENPM